MPETCRCPHCGAPAGTGAPARQDALGLLHEEVRRIRELAQAREDAAASRRIAELTREVHELRATVARLRGSAGAATPSADFPAASVG